MTLAALLCTVAIPCPSYPPLAPASAVAADPLVKSAVQRAAKLLASKAQQLPTGLVGTIVYDQQTLWSA